MRRVWFVVSASPKNTLVLSRTVYGCTLMFTYKWPHQNRNPISAHACRARTNTLKKSIGGEESQLSTVRASLLNILYSQLWMKLFSHYSLYNI